MTRELESNEANMAFRSFLSYIVFQAEHIRIGLEITFCIFLYYTFRFAFPWDTLNMPSDWVPLGSWFIACGLLVVCDQVILCKPLRLLRKSRYLDIDGAYDHALSYLEKIGPAAQSLIPFPKKRYHLERVRILTHAERFQDAEEELSQAHGAGLTDAEFHLARSLIYKAKHEVDAALSELQAVQQLWTNNPIVVAEQGLIELYERKDYRAAKAAFKRVVAMPNVHYLEGGSFAQIVTGYLHVTRLWTGEAEEALNDLSQIIAELRVVAQYNREYRPFLAALLLERAYYFATHREPNGALRDMRIARGLCAYPPIKRRLGEINDELSWRFSIEPC